MTGYLGIDVGSISTNLVVLGDAGEVVAKNYLRTRGQPIQAVQQGLRDIQKALPPGLTTLASSQITQHISKK